MVNKIIFAPIGAKKKFFEPLFVILKISDFGKSGLFLGNLLDFHAKSYYRGPYAQKLAMIYPICG